MRTQRETDLEDEIERLTALYDQMVRVNGNMKVENDRLEAKVAELEAEVKALWLEKIKRDNVANREGET